MGNASIMAISDGAVEPTIKCYKKGKGRKGPGVAIASSGVDAEAYTPVKLPKSMEAF